MTLSYDILFRLRVQHQYYTQNFSEDFILLPTPSTQVLLERLNLLFRPIPHGCTILVRVVPGSAPPVMYYDLPLNEYRFSFLMIPKDPYFLNFTAFENNLAPQPGKDLLYFSNVSRSAVDAPVLGDEVSTAAGTYLELVDRPIYNLLFDTPVSSATPILRDLFNNSYTPTPVLNLSGGDTTSFLQFNLKAIREFGPGRYRLSDANLADDKHLYYEAGIGGSGSFAVIDIFNDTSRFEPASADLIDPAFKYLDGNILKRNGGNLVADYLLPLKPSQYNLNYIVRISQSGIPSGELLIHDPDNTVNFTATTNGPNEVTFSSNSLISWNEEPQAFELKRNDGVTITKVKNLPNPTTFLPVKKDTSTDLLYYDLNIYV